MPFDNATLKKLIGGMDSRSLEVFRDNVAPYMLPDHAVDAEGEGMIRDKLSATKASELLTTAGFKRIDRPSDKYDVQMSIFHFRKRLSPARYSTVSSSPTPMSSIARTKHEPPA